MIPMLPEGMSAYPLILVITALAAKFAPLPAAYHPLTFFRFLADRLADKVHPTLSRSVQQQRLSGTLAMLVTLLPALALGYALYHFSELPYLLDALLLYFSLDWSLKQQQAAKVAANIERNQLTLAREQADLLLLRDTSTLTAMGLSKACIESLLLRSARQVIAVFFWFLCGGGLATATYRLLQELSLQWNGKLPRFRYFGQPARLCVNILAIPAMLISYSIITLQAGILLVFRRFRQINDNTFPYLQFWLLSAAASALNISLGGPLYYQQQKQHRSRIIREHEPEARDILRTLTLLNYLHFYSLLLATSVCLIQFVLFITR